MRVLIYGGSGMLGHALWRTCRERFDAYATVRVQEPPGPVAEILDRDRTIAGVRIEEPGRVARALDEARPDAVVNCVGVIKQAVDDPVPAIRANALFPHELADTCRRRGVRLIHVSTDCVFSGKRGRYAESDIPDPVDLYGRSKLLGEPTEALIIRTSMIGRELVTSNGLLEWFLSRAAGSVRGFARAVFSGPTTPVLSRAIADVIEHHTSLTGLHHVSAAPIAKLHLLELVRDAFGVDVEIEPDESVVVDRSLDSARFREATGWAPPSWVEMVHELADAAPEYENVRNALARG
jgi:dTDP-4-dehydrorhamnose reductase